MKTLIILIFLNIWSFTHGRANLHFRERCVEEYPVKCGRRLQWYYDVDKRRCLTKVDDMCPGLNRFPTREACQARCVYKQTHYDHYYDDEDYYLPRKNHKRSVGEYDGVSDEKSRIRKRSLIGYEIATGTHRGSSGSSSSSSRHRRRAEKFDDDHDYYYVDPSYDEYYYIG